jgi:hypothetical protein
MKLRALNHLMGKGRWLQMVLVAAIALILVKLNPPSVSKPLMNQPFSMEACLNSIPDKVKGLEIHEGSRSEASIIRDMQPVVCGATALYAKMMDEGEAVGEGCMTFQVVVEYNGEVISVRIIASDITHSAFRNKLIDMISELDFVSWPRQDTDTLFIFPMNFGGSK